MGKYKDENGTSRIGDFLRKNAPHIIDVVGDVLPDQGGLGMIKNIINKDTKMSAKAKEEAMKLVQAELDDLKDARDMYKSTDHETADFIAERVIDYNLWVVLLAVIIEIVAVIYIDDKILIAVISGAIGSITTALLQERQQVINFFFGSSKGSKDKDKLKFGK